MDNQLGPFLARLDCGDPVSEAALEALSAQLRETYSAQLPDDYVAFLRHANGADGNLPGGNPVVFWEAESLVEVNEDYNTLEYMPGFLVVGSDTGDYPFGIDLRPNGQATARYLETEDVSMDWDYVLWSGASFLELLRHLDGSS